MSTLCTCTINIVCSHTTRYILCIYNSVHNNNTIYIVYVYNNIIQYTIYIVLYMYLVVRAPLIPQYRRCQEYLPSADRARLPPSIYGK